MIRNAVLLLAVTGLSGCLAFTSSEMPPSTYTIHYQGVSGGPVPLTGARSVLKIDEPDMPVGLETDRIALFLNNGRQLDYYAGAKWPEPLDHVLQDAIVQAGHQVLPQMTIDSEEINLPGDYRLAVKVSAFAPVYAGAATSLPRLKAAMIFTLIRLPEQAVMTSFTLTREADAPSNDLTAITGGLENLLQAMLTEAYGTIGKTLE